MAGVKVGRTGSAKYRVQAQEIMGRGWQCKSGKYGVQAQEIMGEAMNARVQDTFIQTFAMLSLQNSKEAIKCLQCLTGL